jgi:histidinol-phosphate phosphatase family protein
MQAVILAGGKGTRLAGVTGDLPKSLVDVAGTPLLGRQLQMLAEQGLRDVVVLTGHGGERIADYCGDGSQWGLAVQCVREAVARGTAGAVLDALPMLQQRFVVLYGDTVMDVDLDRMVGAHLSAGALATLFLHPNDHPQDSDLVELDRSNRVRAIHPYPHDADAELPNLVNAALYVLERDFLAGVDGLPDKPDFGRHVFPRMLELGLAIHGYKSPEYVKDAGTPERIERVRRDLETGRVAGRSFREPAAAVFLDRDGVLNVERGLVSRPAQLQLIGGAGAALRRLNDSPFRAICITNQPVVARGDATWDELDRIQARLDTLLGRDGAFLDGVYICPHHPDGGFEGEISELKIVCGCRKPATGLIDRAAAEFHLSLARSWMVGDRTADIELARRAGLRSILVRTGHGGEDGQFAVVPDYVVDDLGEAVELILRESAGHAVPRRRAISQ